ncbi:MAG: 2-oxoacid:ferredoxin oxidoreductase subunit beta [Deltaproteobacteria bacterium]|nr:2-oxoacid:ferredoxin oxidoreductase subunit beta [Deltaproteobacteria bacterium]
MSLAETPSGARDDGELGDAAKLTRKDFESDQDVRWCPGCGDYAILAQVQKLMPELAVARENTVFVSGIGCSSRFPYYMNTYGFHGIHGRAPALATGLKLARPELSVWIVTGDGDGLSIGGNHLIHLLRRNLDVNVLLFNNEIYGLTKGQYSPTSRQGLVTKSSPLGVVDPPFDVASLALGAGATFIARTVDVESRHMLEVLRRAALHKGTSFVEIVQNCPVFNDGVHEELTDRAIKNDHQLLLEHGKPLLFGEGLRKGIRLRADLSPEVVSLDEVDIGQIALHDETSPVMTQLLARLGRQGLPMPLGVLRCVAGVPRYEQAVRAQVVEARAAKGAGDFDALFRSGETWTVG